MLGGEVALYLTGVGIGLTATTTGTSGPVYGIPFPPDAPDQATCVISYAGSQSYDAFGPSLQAAVAESARFQVVTRNLSNNAASCEALAQSIYKNLRHYSGTMAAPGSTSTVTYAFVRALGPVFFLKYDEVDRPYYACNFQAIKGESS